VRVFSSRGSRFGASGWTSPPFVDSVTGGVSGDLREDGLLRPHAVGEADLHEPSLRRFPLLGVASLLSARWRLEGQNLAERILPLPCDADCRLIGFDARPVVFGVRREGRESPI
jgi:hypothetical protein